MFNHKPKPEELNTATFDELLELKLKVDQLIKDKKGNELDTLKQKMSAAASALGFTFTFGESIQREFAKARRHSEKKGKYLNPDTGEVVSGRGKMPKWMKEKIAADPTLTKESFLVDKPNDVEV